MVTRFLILALLASCTTRTVSPPPPTAEAISSLFADPETEDWAVRAALLDPACYSMVSTLGYAGSLDVTVPDGHAWHVTNAFAVHYGEPIDVAQDGIALIRRSGFIRPLDARRTLTLGAGTRIRGNVGVQPAYVFFCDPQVVWDTDPRYTIDPRGLYYQRLQRLRSIPTQSAVLESTSGGGIGDDLHLYLPAQRLIITSASVYDSSWVVVQCPEWGSDVNVLNEINNDHGVRFAESILQPLPGCGARVQLQKGTLGDTWGPATMATPSLSSADPAVAYPIHGSGSLTFQVLPEDW